MIEVPADASPRKALRRRLRQLHLEGMSEMKSQNPKGPFHLTAPWPAHYRMRIDLIEELCIPEAFARTLPRTPEEHARWLAMWSLSADRVPFASIAQAIRQAYQPTAHYLLKPAIFPGYDYIQNVLTDERGWSVCCELGGLYDFVVARAVQFCVSRGHQHSKAQAMLYPKLGMNPGPDRRHGWWAIRYERATGFCTVVPSNKGMEEFQDPAGK